MRTFALFVLLFCIKSPLVFADTFVVTTNADSGVGSLRAAITLAAANGTAVVDSIIFKIADTSRAGRSITIGDELPDLSSNLLIDGTTQTGQRIGWSDAKIILLLSTRRPGISFNFLKFEAANNIQIFGLFFYKNFSTLFTPPASAATGVKFFQCTNITIGKPGKGNYFRGVEWGIDNRGINYIRNSENISIQSNVFGYNEYGEAAVQDSTGSSLLADAMEFVIFSQNSKNIKIGGDTDIEGNYFYGTNLIVQSDTSDNGVLDLKNNKAGIKMDGTDICQQNIPEIRIVLGNVNRDYYLSDYTVGMVNNNISGSVEIHNIKGFLTVQGNKIFFCSTTAITSAFERLAITWCSGGGIVGGALPGQANELYTVNCTTDFLNGGTIGSIRVVMSPKINLTKNITYAIAGFGSSIQVEGSGEPYIQIDSTAINFVKGKATPNCKIEVFLDDECWACNGKLFLGQTTSNNDSTWSFTGNFSGTVVATATKSDSTSSGYAEPLFKMDSVKVIQPTCGLPNGSIKGFYGFTSTTNVEWHKITYNIFAYPYIRDTVVATTIDLQNATPGIYYFIARRGQTCHSAAIKYTLVNYTPFLDTSFVSVTQPTCGIYNGSIQGFKIKDAEYSSYKWVNDQNIIFTGGDFGITSNVFLNNLPQGKYRLIVTDNRNGCADTSRFYTLTNQSGPSLNTNTAAITLATCGNPNGSIKGITATNTTGTQFIQWTDSLENIVGNNLNLENVRAGKYRLRFKDQGSCDTIVTPYFVMRDTTAILINIANRIVVPAGCTFNNGSISNVKVTNATAYSWVNMNGNIPAGNTLDIRLLSSSFYRLTATNTLGCSASSNGIFVSNASFDTISVTDFAFKNAGCNNADGFIRINSFNKNAAKHSFRWIDSATNRQLATNISISVLGKAVYVLMAADSNGCERKIFSKSIDSLPTPDLDFNTIVITNEACGNKQGSITGLTVKNLIGPTTYEWTDSNNTEKGNALSLTNIPAGRYKLNVVDGNCFIATSYLEIINDKNGGTNPQYSNMVVTENTPATLRVTNFEAGTYILYEDAAGTKELQRNNSGVFVTSPITGNTVLFVKHSTDKCISQLVPITIFTVKSSFFTIAKAFTPNDDLVNNRLTVRVTGVININYFRIFNRFGQLVFETSKLNDFWDGKLNGISQPVGAYIWIAEGKDATGTIIRDKGSIVLFR